MTAFTSKASGNWSSGGQTTWNEAGVPGSGDTVTIGAHTITVDANTSIGTSPNDSTTKAIDRSSASSKLLIATGKTLTIKGNVGGVNGSTLEMQAGSSVVFDATASGGTPVYKFINAGADKFVLTGTSVARCSLSAAVGYTFGFPGAWWMNATYTDFARCSSFTSTNSTLAGLDFSVTHCTLDSCASFNVTFATATLGFTFTDVSITNSTNASESFKLTLATARTSGTREVARVSSDKSFNNQAKDLYLHDCALGGMSCYDSGTSSFFRPPHDVFLFNTLNLNGGNGMALSGSWNRLYVTVDHANGNPHYLGPIVKNAVDETYTACIFESQTPDLIDTGDAFILNGAFCSSGLKLTVRNCIAIQSGYTWATVQSGQLITSYSPPASNATHQVQVIRNTVNQNESSSGSGPRAAIAYAEGATGAANQISALKSNVVWSSSADNGYLAERISGTTKDHIAVAGVAKNWTHNLRAGDNQRGYRDRANSPAQTLWTSGDAVAAGVDADQSSGDPAFLDSSRNMAKWCYARGHGAQTYAAAKTALLADPSRVSDLISYVFEGFKPTSTAMRSAAHDGGCAGAANFHKAARRSTKTNALSARVFSDWAV